MLTPEEVTERLDEAERAIAAGTVAAEPHEFVEGLWARIHQEAPEALQDAVHSRLMDFAERLGIEVLPDFPEA